MNNIYTKPRIAVTMGDPSGIGPEIVIKALTHKEIYEWCFPVICGNIEILDRVSVQLGLPDIIQQMKNENKLEAVSAGDFSFAETGKASFEGGKTAYDCIKKAVDLCMSRDTHIRTQAIVTAPINKEGLKIAGVPYIGHTEILAGLTGSNDPLTMFYVRGMKIFFLTRHIPFAQIPSYCTEERIFDYIVRCTQYINDTEKPFAVAALNPHGGDGGLFGEEEREIKRAVERACKEKINAEGPIPADSVFHMTLKGGFSGVLSLYHDQGHIAAKTLDFVKTVAVTYGLPFLRTSVDHGTAFDIAGKGVADETSMIEAIRVAAEEIE